MSLPKWANYVARDEDGCVFAFENKPYKDDDGEWLKAAGEHCRLPDASYPHVKWEDEQPLYLGVKNEEVTSENVEHPKHYNIGCGMRTENITCRWNLSTVLDCVIWSSDCGLDWQFSNPETPADNEMVYCPKCGRKLEVAE